jgi:uncharacterized membrane protein (UPF0136 family)
MDRSMGETVALTAPLPFPKVKPRLNLKRQGHLRLFHHHRPTGETFMLNPLVGQVTLGIYAVLLAVGGIMGFVKAGSRPSLIAGVASAVAALVALGLSAAGSSAGLPMGLFVSVFLLVFFGSRFAKGRKFMPAGLMAAVSLVVAAILIVALIPGGAG